MTARKKWIGPKSLKGSFKKSTYESKTHILEKSKGSLEIIMGWPKDQRLGHHFVAKWKICQVSNFPTLWEKNTCWTDLIKFHKHAASWRPQSVLLTFIRSGHLEFSWKTYKLKLLPGILTFHLLTPRPSLRSYLGKNVGSRSFNGVSMASFLKWRFPAARAFPEIRWTFIT